MSLDCFFSRVYDEKKYNCANLVVEVWAKLKGEDIAEKLDGFLKPPAERKIPSNIRTNFKKLDKPVSPCIAVFFRKGYEPHTGIYYKRKIFHITRKGVQFQPLDVVSFCYKKVGFYA
jgi:hypothetical protein